MRSLGILHRSLTPISENPKCMLGSQRSSVKVGFAMCCFGNSPKIQKRNSFLVNASVKKAGGKNEFNPGDRENSKKFIKEKFSNSNSNLVNEIDDFGYGDENNSLNSDTPSDLFEGIGSLIGQPKPPAGFILDQNGEVELIAPEDKRMLTIVDRETGKSLSCCVRRTFVGSQGYQFYILLPLDTPIIILRIATKPESGLIELDDDEMVEILPNAAYALAKKNMFLVNSGFCLTARGAFCFTPNSVIDIDTEYGFGIGSDLNEGVEICTFKVNGKDYVVYTPFDPLIFVAYKNEYGVIEIVEDNELLDDPKVMDAIEEEEEFKELVEEEEAILEAMRQEP